jgi:hypothetical protein
VVLLDEYQKQRAIVALRRLESEKDIKRYKLNEHFQNVRLCLLLRLPYAVIKMHHNCRMSVCNETGLVRFQFPDEYIPIRRFLQRSDAPTFESWLQEFHPEEFEKYKRDKMRFLFGTNTELKHTDAAQSLYDEFDRFCWFKNEEERRYFFSSLLDGVDVDALDEFGLFGSVGGHSQAEIDSFKSELLEMQKQYLECPESFFRPSDDLIADADAVLLNDSGAASGSDSILVGCAPPGCDGERASCSDMIDAENEQK